MCALTEGTMEEKEGTCTRPWWVAIQGELWHKGPLPVPGCRLRSIHRHDKSAILRSDLGDSVPLSASSTSGVELTASDPR